MKELQTKSNSELAKHVNEKREELRKFRFGIAGSGMRNTKAIRNLRKDIARALTEANIRARKSNENIA